MMTAIMYNGAVILSQSGEPCDRAITSPGTKPDEVRHSYMMTIIKLRNEDERHRNDALISLELQCKEGRYEEQGRGERSGTRFEAR
jgi:hypothetical protein